MVKKLALLCRGCGLEKKLSRAVQKIWESRYLE